MIIIRKAWDSPVEYPSKEFEHEAKESDVNMFNPIFKGSVKGRKYPGRCAFGESEVSTESVNR